MSIRLNHTIVWTRNKAASSAFLSSVLGRPNPTRYGPFAVVELDNDVSLDFHDTDGTIAPQHYAFLVSDAEFETILERIRQRGIRYFADPARSKPNEINSNDGGQGCYFEDPDGHLLEIITRPYGSG